jgi:hypothetical protein
MVLNAAPSDNEAVVDDVSASTALQLPWFADRHRTSGFHADGSGHRWTRWLTRGHHPFVVFAGSNYPLGQPGTVTALPLLRQP